MLRVLDECDRTAADFSADPVHDLRVALRRCRSMADGLMAMDPDPEWKAMKKAGKQLFQRLGALRDIQVMMEWIEKLHPDEETPVKGFTPAFSKTQDGALDQSATQRVGEVQELQVVEEPRHSPHHALLQILRERESKQKGEAQAALEEFDRKEWKQWAKSLPLRAAHIRPGNAVFKHLALEHWTQARDLHLVAMRNRSQVALHTLRIGIKRFRYIVENFLPEEHKLWSRDLKDMQDVLGEVHDLDVLWATALSCRIFPDAASRKAWHEVILEARTKRVDKYRKKMVGPETLWQTWRAGLPQGQQVQAIATRRMKLWAKVLDEDFEHAERVARLALELYDGIIASGLLAIENARGARSSLQIAALLHDVGKSQGDKGHHKASQELIRSHGTPLGWNDQEMQRAAIVARFHCGALPTPGHKALRDLLPPEQKLTIQLAAILRLANAFDVEHDGHIRKVRVEAGPMRKRRANGFLRRSAPTLAKNEALVIAAEGYNPNSPTAQTIAAERFLLETVLKRPVVVKSVPGVRLPVAGAA